MARITRTFALGASVAGHPTHETPDASPAAPLNLVERLCEALEDQGVGYCHWKSTDALDRSATGENDLDLLVAERDGERFETILRELGFREALVRASQRAPGVRHFYGLDVPSGLLVDVHAHEQLVLGDDATKNYRLPIEEPYLASVRRAGLFMVPAPELELAVLVVRLMLKHGSPEAICTGRGSLSDRERGELLHLGDAIDRATLRRRLRHDAAMLDPALLDRCIDSMCSQRSFASRVATWKALRECLAPFARRSRSADVWLQCWRRVDGRFRRHVLRRSRGKRLATGGRVIALIGGDGSGKSTVARSLDDWLFPVFSTARVHLGKPPPSLAWLALRCSVHVARRMGIAASPPIFAEASHLLPPYRHGYVWLITSALTARDRRRAAARTRRLASRGRIVICDRYPVPEITVDGPRSGRAADLRLPGFSRYLAELERRYYTGIPRPNVVIVLRVDPEIAIRRRPGEDPLLIHARSTEVWDADWRSNVAVVDASRTREDVLADVKAEVWSRL